MVKIHNVDRPRFLILVAAVVVVLGLRFVWLSPSGAAYFQIYAGYWVVLVALGLWFVLFGRFLKATNTSPRAVLKDDRIAIAFILLATFFLQLHEPHILRVLYDETSHAAGACVMHYQKKAVMPGVSHYIGDVFVMGDYYPSFRQYLFQVIISLLHDFTGYRIENIFILNAVLTFCFLAAVYGITKKLVNPLAGWIAVACFATLPLLAQNSTSGGYDVLNLTLIAGLYYGVLEYIQSDEIARPACLDFIVYTGLLLSMARYESILYLVPIALTVACIWWRDRRVELTWISAISPIFLLPNFVSNLTMFSNPRYLHAHLRKAGEQYFGLNYLPGHLADAVFYLFNIDRNMTNSSLLSTIGILGLIVLWVHTACRHRHLSKTVAFAVFSGWTVLTYVFVLTQFWSTPTDILASRFILPVYFVAVVAGSWLVVQIAWLKKRPAVIFVGILGWYVAETAPVTSMAMATHMNATSRSERWALEKATAMDRTQNLFAASSNVGLVAYRFASVGMDLINNNPAKFIRAEKAGLYKDIYIFQSMEMNPATGVWAPRSDNILNGNIVVETVDEKLVMPSYKARMLRFLGYKNSKGELVDRQSEDPEVALKTEFKNIGASEIYRETLYPY